MAEPRQGAFTIVALGLLAAAFVVAFGFAVAEYATDGSVIRSMALSWELARAGVRFFSWTPALVLGVCAAAMNTAAGRKESGSPMPAALAASFVGIAAAAALVLLGPSVASNLDSLEARSRLFREALRGASEARAGRDFGRALSLLDRAEEIDRKDESLVKLKEAILEDSLRAPSAAAPSAPAPATALRTLELDASGFLALALEAEKSGDWYTAHFEAGRALVLDPRMAEALRVQAKAWERIRALAEDPEAMEKAGFFARKFAAYKLLREGDALGAWRAFKALAEEAPGDGDVARYFRESETGLRELAIFAEDAREELVESGGGAFLARSELEGNGYVIISARSFAERAGAIWLDEPELLAIRGRAVAWHVRSAFGRLGAEALILRSVEPDGRASEAETLAGDPPWEVPGTLPSMFAPSDARLLARLRSPPAAVGLLPLLEAVDAADRFGFDPAPYRREFAARAGLAVAVFALALTGAGLGARLRGPSPGGPLSALAGTVVVTGCAIPLLEAAARVGVSTLDAALAASPWPTGALVWAGLMAAMALAAVAAASRYLSRG